MLHDFFISFLADWLVFIIVAVAGYAMLFKVPHAQKYEIYAKSLLAGLLALWFAKIASLLYQGERPFVTLGIEAKASYLDNPGFPSDHALFVCAIACMVWAATHNKKLGIFLFAAAVLVMWGRMLALVHTPADVAGGAACAIVAAGLVYGRRFWQSR